MSLEEKVQSVLKDVLDVGPDEIKPDQGLDIAFGVDSTEMVEINVALKKLLGLDDMQNNTISKTNTYNEILGILKGQGATE